MRKVLGLMLLLAFSTFSIVAKTDDPKRSLKSAIRVAPEAPRFSDTERQAELARRRKKVADGMVDNSMLILFSADSKLYTNDVDYVYRQENNLYYLTALKQNGVTFVITKQGEVIDEYVFLPKRNPQFETWNGKMYSNEDATRLSGVKNIIDARKQKEFLEAVTGKRAFVSDDGSSIDFVPQNVYLLNGDAREYGKAVEFAKQLEGQGLKNALPIFAEARQVKSPYEIKLMQHAVDITGEALGRSMGMIGRANWEYEVQAEVEYTFRRRNADFWGYPSIVGCGPNATTLHYVESQGKVNKGDLMLMDVGAEYDHYTADVTRTFPVNGKFTKEQAEIYQIVFDAQEAASAKLRPGASIRDAGTAALEVIEEGLAKLGLITAPGATFDVEFRGRKMSQPQYRLWYMHGWGHWLGMNVHDVSRGATLKEGMMMTNEPGIYLRSDALDYLPKTEANLAFIAKVKPVFEKYKNIGVRIEDDMLITADGVDWMTKDIPRSIKDVENFISEASKEMKGYAAAETVLTPGVARFGFGINRSRDFDFDFINASVLLEGKTIRGAWRHDAFPYEHAH